MQETGQRDTPRRVVLISASPRRHGNTETLLACAAQGAQDRGAQTVTLVLNELTIAPCQECAEPDPQGRCRFSDGMDEVFERIQWSDSIIFGSPVFFGSVSAQAKAMIDRFQCWWLCVKTGQHRNTARIGAFICVAASRREDFFRNARAVVRNFFATVGAHYAAELFCGGLEGRDATSARADCREAAYRIGVLIAAGDTGR